MASRTRAAVDRDRDCGPLLPSVSIGRAAIAVGLGALAGLAGALLPPTTSPSGLALAGTLAPLAIAAGVLATLCDLTAGERREGIFGAILLVVLSVAASTVAARIPVRELCPCAIIIPIAFLLFFFRRGRADEYPLLTQHLWGQGLLFFASVWTVFRFPPERQAAACTTAAWQVLIAGVMLRCTLRSPAVLDEWRNAWNRSPGTGCQGFFGVILVFLAAIVGLSDRELEGPAEWLAILGGIALAAALFDTFESAWAEFGFAAMSEEIVLMFFVATSLCQLFGLVQIAWVPLAAQAWVFVRWVWKAIGWPVLLVHLAPGLAIGGAAFVTLAAPERPALWPVYGAMLGAACAIEAVQWRVMEALALSLDAAGRRRLAFDIFASLAQAGRRRETMLHAAVCARAIGESAQAGKWFERAGDWEQAGLNYLAAVRKER